MSSSGKDEKSNSPEYNSATRIITTVLGITLASGGLTHGIFEILQGNVRTDGFIVQAIGPLHRMWRHGTEEAFTLIPNFLFTGIVAVIMSIFIIIWSAFYAHKKYGPAIFLILFIMLTLTGGGIGHIVFFLTVWAYSRKLNKPLSTRPDNFYSKYTRVFPVIWLYALPAAVSAFIIGLAMSVFGYFPGLENEETILAVCWSFLLLSLLLINVTYISGFAYDRRVKIIGKV